MEGGDLSEMRTVELTWQELQEQLAKGSSTIFPDEEIREITLMKPKKVRLYLADKQKNKKEGG